MASALSSGIILNANPVRVVVNVAQLLAGKEINDLRMSVAIKVDGCMYEWSGVKKSSNLSPFLDVY